MAFLIFAYNSSVTKNKYIVLNSVSANKNSGGLVVLSAGIGTTKAYISLFGVQGAAFTILVDDLVQVRQFSLNHKVGELEIEKDIDDFVEIVIGVFDSAGELIFVGSTIGIQTKAQKERLCVALEKKDSLSHFGSLAKKAIASYEKSFFDETILVLLELFEYGVPDLCLEKLIPNSKWVKVFSEKEVVGVGVVEKSGRVDSVGLAFPVICKNQKNKNIDSNFSFLPLSNSNPNGFGYYIVLQSAKDGKVVPMHT